MRWDWGRRLGEQPVASLPLDRLQVALDPPPPGGGHLLAGDHVRGALVRAALRPHDRQLGGQGGGLALVRPGGLAVGVTRVVEPVPLHAAEVRGAVRRQEVDPRAARVLDERVLEHEDQPARVRGDRLVARGPGERLHLAHRRVEGGAQRGVPGAAGQGGADGVAAQQRPPARRGPVGVAGATVASISCAVGSAGAACWRAMVRDGVRASGRRASARASRPPPPCRRASR